MGNYDQIEPTWQDQGPNDHGYNRGGPYDIPDEGTVILRPNYKPSFAWLVVIKGARPGQIFPLNEKGLKIGRSGNCEIVLAQDNSVSLEHAKVYKEDEEFVVHDLASANGTFVNGKKAYHQALTENDRLIIGQTVLVFKQIKEADLDG